MKNNTMKEIAEVLTKAESILIFTHLNMDGDALGTSCALAREFRKMGKRCWVLLNDDVIADDLVFLTEDFCTTDPNVIEAHDVSLAVDASLPDRFPNCAEKFLAGKVKVCLDHHVIDHTDWEYNYIDPHAAAAGELAVLLLEAMGVQPSKEAAEALFCAITTDTGNFQFSNTTKRTHEVMARLYDAGIDVNGVSNRLYENVKPEKILLRAEAIRNMELLADGRLAITGVTHKMLEETGAHLSDAEGIVHELRSIRGVEVAILVKEGEDACYGSFRAKSTASVRGLAQQFGGGGHEKAAGCTVQAPFADVYGKIRAAAEAYLES